MHLKIYSLLNENAIPFTFICVEIVITFFVKINKLVGINIIHPITKDETNHRFKLVIVLEMLMLFTWLTPQEVVTITQICTTCNALEDGMGIADDI
jgi:hypothetical protein